MAIYEYEILDDQENVLGIYETEQKMSEPALTRHPETGQRLRRILSATFAHGSSSSSSFSGCESGACGPFGGGGGCDTGGCCGGGACGLN